MITREQFDRVIWDMVENSPAEWRKGQAVFNAVDSQFGVARTVQFFCRVDCFYNDDNIDEFLDRAYEMFRQRISYAEEDKEG